MKDLVDPTHLHQDGAIAEEVANHIQPDLKLQDNTELSLGRDH